MPDESGDWDVLLWRDRSGDGGIEVVAGEVFSGASEPDVLYLPMAEYRKINPEGAILMTMDRSGNARQRRRAWRAAQREIRALSPCVDRDAWALAE